MQKRRQIEIDEEVRDMVANFKDYEFYDENGLPYFERGWNIDGFFRVIQRASAYLMLKLVKMMIDHPDPRMSSFTDNDFYQKYEEHFGILSGHMLSKPDSPERKKRLQIYKAKAQYYLIKTDKLTVSVSIKTDQEDKE